MATLTELQKVKDELSAKLKLVNEAISEKLSQTLVRCGSASCLRGYEIRELDYIDEQKHEEECGYGGSYRVYHEGQWICPQCKHLNRLYKQPEIDQLKYLFKSQSVKVI